MSTKAKPAKKPAKPTPAAKPAKEQPPELNINVNKSAETTSLTGTGVLSYEIGLDDSDVTHYRVTVNNAAGSSQKSGSAVLPSMVSAMDTRR